MEPDRTGALGGDLASTWDPVSAPGPFSAPINIWGWGLPRGQRIVVAMEAWLRVRDAGYDCRVFCSRLQIQCLLCRVASLERVVEAALLYIGEHQYLGVNAEPPAKI